MLCMYGRFANALKEKNRITSLKLNVIPLLIVNLCTKLFLKNAIKKP